MDAFSGFQWKAALAVTLTLVISPALGAILCEHLPADYCAFSVSSAGTRCVLEKYVLGTQVKYECRSSDVLVDSMVDWIETDECIQACGLERNSVGISSDSLLEPMFIQKLCSPNCYQLCPNIVDLYFNLAAGEGVYLPKLCEAQRSGSRQEVVEINSSGKECVGVEGPVPLVPVPADAPIPIDPWPFPPYGEPLPYIPPGTSPSPSPYFSNDPSVTVPDPNTGEAPLSVGSLAVPPAPYWKP